MAGVWVAPKSAVTGDSGRVLVMAERFRSTAESIRSAARSLRALDDGGSSSDAVDAFMKKAEELAGQLGHAEGRYEATGSALSVYAGSLESAQQSAGRALREYEVAVDDEEAHERQARQYRGRALLETDDESKRYFEDQARLHEAKSDDARSRISSYGRVVDEAHEAVAAAAALAISRIDDATGDGLRDSVFDDIGGVAGVAYEGFQAWMVENDAWISQVSFLLDVVGLVLTAGAVIFPVLAPFAIAAMVVSLALSVARAAAGTGTLTAVALNLFSVVTFGIGKGLVVSARAGARGVAANRVTNLVGQGYSPRLANQWVGRSLERARPTIGSRILLKSLGDVDVARITHFLRAGRPGWSPSEAEQVMQILRKLKAVRILAAVNTAKSSAAIVDTLRTPAATTPLGRMRTVQRRIA